MRAGIKLEPEVSFQGGDGYMFFSTPELARATLTRIAEIQPAHTDPDAPTDPFYRRTDLSLDFYRAIRSHQREHLESQTYSRALTAFGLGLLNSTGSRVSRRQSDIRADREMSLRQIRAIPHNAILQQLGYPVNIISGIGSAADGNYEELAALIMESERGRQLIQMRWQVSRPLPRMGNCSTVPIGPVGRTVERKAIFPMRARRWQSI